MSTEKLISEHIALKRQPALDLSQNVDALSPQQRAASRIDAVIAVIHSDLRVRSSVTNDLIKRSLASVSNTMDMIAFSQEAIARSRALLDDAPERIIQNRRQIVANIDEPEIGVSNMKSPFSNVGYIIVVTKPPSAFHLLLVNQRKIYQLSHHV